MTIKLVNESALGVHRFSWTSPSMGTRCELLWPGFGSPQFTYFSTGLGRMTDMLTVQNPQRFGWDAKRTKLADFKAFAERYAAACEEDE